MEARIKAEMSRDLTLQEVHILSDGSHSYSKSHKGKEGVTTLSRSEVFSATEIKVETKKTKKK